MATYDLARLNVLVVDDSSFLRTLLSRVLRTLDIRQLEVAEDGAEAIQILKNLNHPNSSMRQVDVVISDWIMSPVDGAMLLKWIRTHRESPDPFITFIMMSALSEPEKVKEARDLGANEFLAKPFSIDTIAKKITSVVERRRNFVASQDYFGPDRRRNQLNIDFDNRRTATRENIKVIHGGKIKTTFEDPIKAYYINNPVDLRAKVGGSDKDPGHVSTKSMNEASVELEHMAADYADWVKVSIGKMFSEYQAVKDGAKNVWRHFGVINTIAHDLRGQGETFGYPLITIFGKSLYEYTLMPIQEQKLDDDFVELIHAHINLIQIVIRDKINGDGGSMGHTLRDALSQAKEKYQTNMAERKAAS